MAREFVVLVARPGKQPMGYPPAEGGAALKSMETLAGRGLTVAARTTANGITEELTIEEMRSLFEEDA
jgi:hypothetical protein